MKMTTPPLIGRHDLKPSDKRIETADGLRFRPLIDSSRITTRIQEIAKQIEHDYKEKCPIFIAVMNGAYILVADLMRELKIDSEVDFIKISSYENQVNSMGTVRLVKDISADITGRDVIIVEDIIDSGLSAKFLRNRMKEAKPTSLAFVTLLFKKEVARIDFEIDYVGFEIGKEFVIGYGLDYGQKYRNLKDIWVIEEDGNSAPKADPS